MTNPQLGLRAKPRQDPLAPMWTLSISDDQASKTIVKLSRDDYSVGRAEGSAVRLTERNISREHALIQRSGVSWALVDQDSYNGCYVNGTRVSGNQALEHGDLVQVGDYRMELLNDEAPTAGEYGPRSATLPSVPKSRSLLGQPDRLVMLVGPTPGIELALAGKSVTIGRGEECDIAIEHSSVSRVHAEIQATEGKRYEIIDRGSANGVRINGVELERGLIDARDNIELGDVVLKFIPAGVVYKPGAGESQQIDAASVAEHLRSSPEIDVVVPEPGVSPLKIVAGMLGLVFLVVLGMLIFQGGGDDAESAPTPANSNNNDSTGKTLEAASKLLGEGKVKEAHDLLLSKVPASSNARQSQIFRDVEAKWADSLFEKAAAESDLAKKRALLDQIAKAPTVDSARRKRAANEIEKLAADSIDVDELPGVVKPGAKPDAAAPGAKQPEITRNDPYGSKTAPAPAPKKAGTVNDDATSGDRKRMEAAKNRLLAKGAGASIGELRMLRGLCLQLGDQGCVGRASGLLKAKVENQ